MYLVNLVRSESVYRFPDTLAGCLSLFPDAAFVEWHRMPDESIVAIGWGNRRDDGTRSCHGLRDADESDLLEQLDATVRRLLDAGRSSLYQGAAEFSDDVE